MNLEKSWAITRKHLDKARQLLPVHCAQYDRVETIGAYEEFFNHNELECALDQLEGLGEANLCPQEFWQELKLAAENMGLTDRLAFYEEKMILTANKELKRLYEEMIQRIASVVNDWDPYDLIGGGAPDNEFSEEVAQIAAKVSKIITPAELAEVISTVFSKNFGAELNFSAEACLPVASKIFNELRTLGVIGKSKE